MTTTFRPLLLAIAAAVAQGAAAQPPGDRDPAERLRRADADGDGKVTRDEFIKARTAEIEAAFARIDGDGNGTLDDKEMAAAAERMRPAGGREGRRPEGERPRRADGDRPRRPDSERPPRPGVGPGGEEAFNRFDRDDDGSLSREEFAEGMARMRDFLQRGEGPGIPDRGGRGPEQGLRRPPPQD